MGGCVLVLVLVQYSAAGLGRNGAVRCTGSVLGIIEIQTGLTGHFVEYFISVGVSDWVVGWYLDRIPAWSVVFVLFSVFYSWSWDQ